MLRNVAEVASGPTVGGMVRQRHPSASLPDPQGAEFRRSRACRSQWCGARRVVAPLCGPSTQTCAPCGHLRAEMPLAIRVCPCGRRAAVLDRDQARNLAVQAQGAGQEDTLVRPAATKQKPWSRALAAGAVGNKGL